MQPHKSVKTALATTALSSLMLAAAATLAGAADAPPPRVYRQPPPPPYFLWSGFYAGAHLGVGWGDDGAGSGFIGGGQVGYNYQVNNWVFGVEADFSGTTIGNSANINGFGTAVSTSGGTDWIATVAPRVGYAFDRWLVYGKVGGAWVHGSGSVDVAGLGSISLDATTSGVVFGAGAEYAIGNNWSAKIELDAFDFGGGTGDFETLKAGVNYRFGGF